MASMYEVVFFMDAYNDIDHMVPIIDRILSAGTWSVKLVTTNPFNDYRDDYRIKFLTHRYGIVPANILRYCPVSETVKRSLPRVGAICQSSNSGPGKIHGALFRRLNKRLKAQVTSSIKQIDVPEMLADILNPAAKKVVFIFDHRDTPLATKVTAFAHGKGYPVLSIPHAVDNWDNDLIDTHQLDIHRPNDSVKSWNMYDAVVFPNRYTADRMTAQGLEPERVRILGSTRFSKEWMDQLDQHVTPEYDLPQPGPETLKVVYFLTKPLHGIFSAEVQRTIQFLCKFPNLYLIVKPHTRGMTFSQNDQVNNCLIVQNDTPSEALIIWSDLVVYSATSVILDALRRDKPVLFLKHTVSNVLVFERFITSWTIQCRDQLRDWVWRFLKNKNERTYEPAQARRCLDELVEGEGDGDDIIARYLALIESYLTDSTPENTR
jgi:hypothetical protein